MIDGKQQQNQQQKAQGKKSQQQPPQSQQQLMKRPSNKKQQSQPHQQQEESKSPLQSNQQSFNPIDAKARQEELDFLKKNLLKKLYLDLFQKHSDLYKENSLTFEQFTYDYFDEINSSLDLSKPNYPEFISKIEDFINRDLEMKNNPLNKDINPLELKKVILEKSKEDEWALIQKYQTALYQESQKKIKQDKEEKEKKYLEALANQIKTKADTKDAIEEKKNEVYSYSMNQKQKEINSERKNNEEKLTALKNYYINDSVIGEYITTIENDNCNLDEDNKKVIGIKIDALMKLNEISDEEQCAYREMLVRIIKEKKYENIQNSIRALNYKKELDAIVGMKVNKTYRPDKMNDDERKINKKLLEDSRNYFNMKGE